MIYGDRHFTVSEITALIKGSLEAEYGNVKIEGEISNFRPSSTGHLYFTLKDNDAVISAVMFRGRAAGLDFRPEDGQLVVATGNISVYAKRGTYQIICNSLQKAGVGDILAMLEQRKSRLAAEGLFDEEKKKSLPLFPSRVAVVTSPTGAAIRDILRVTRRRNAGIDIIILPAPVQGEEAAEIIARQISIANAHSLGDVIIIGRGGGSLEDLLPFSEEIVVRAVAESEIPVISAVGHEIDIALSDLAADVRAPTPSAAAEIVSANRVELLQRVRGISDRLYSVVSQRAERIRLLLSQFTPLAMERNFRILIQPILLRLDDAKELLIRGLRDRTVNAKHRLELLKNSMAASSPTEILGRGYAIVTDSESGKIIKDANESHSGQKIGITVSKGGMDAEVTEVRHEKL